MLIPRSVLFGNPERNSPRLSADGVHLAYLRPDANDVMQVWLQQPGEAEDRVLTSDKRRGIRMFVWTYDPKQLIYLQDADGDENWHLFSVNIASGIVRDLTPFQGIQARLVAASHRHPSVALAAMNLLDRRKHDVYRIDLNSGAVELDTENPGDVAQWVADDDLQVRGAIAMAPDGTSELRLRETASKPWRSVRRFSPDDESWAVAFSADGRSLYYRSNLDAPAVRLLKLDVESGEESVIAADPQYDLYEVAMHPTEKTVEAVAFARERLQWQVVDTAVAPDFEALARVRSGDLLIASRDVANLTWLVAYVTDDGPAYFHRYQRGSRAAAFLFSNRSALEELPLARMQPVSFPARDGLTLHGYLTLPAEQPEARQLPAVLLVHGGPWGRDTWGLHTEVQWLANRGYAVLQVNFRGSAGYGRDFLNAGNREWGAAMQDDLVDAVNWLSAQGRVDPRRIAIMGGSYGGYATLAGLTFTPEVFAAGVDIVGPSNLVTLLRSIPPYWTAQLGLFKHRVGDPDTEEDFLASRSPVHFADRIRAPLLVGQGANDPRVKQAESEQIVEAMRRHGLPVQYVVYADEGHGFARPENRLHFYALAEQFLAKHLGGECEPLGAIAGHSGVIET